MASTNSNVVFAAGDPNGLRYISDWSAASGAFPAGATGGDLYKVSVAGTVDGVSFAVGDSLIAAAINASTTTFLANWTKVPNAADVASVHGRIGAVVAAEADYDLGEMGDVDLTTTPPAVDDTLKFDGTNWVPGQSSAGIADWATGVAYKDGQYVWAHAELYKASLDHTSAATFDVDLVANNWDPVSPTVRSWVPSQPVRQGDVQVVNMGGVSVYLAAVASRLTNATFDATEASEWQYIGQAGPGTYVVNQAVVSGFLFRHTDGTVYRRIASGTNVVSFTSLFEEDNWEVANSGSFRGPYSSSAAYKAGDVVVYQHDLYRSNGARASGSWGSAPNIGDGADKFTRMGRIKTFSGDHAYAIGDLVYDATGGNLGATPGVYKVTAAIAALSAPDFDNAVAIATAPIYRGQYGAAKYIIGDVVEYDGKLYRCVVAHGSNNLVGPFTPANWVEIAASTPTQRLAATQASLAPGNYDLDSSSAAFDITLQDVVGTWNFYNTNLSLTTNAVTLKSSATQTFTDATGAQVDADFVLNLAKHVVVLHTETGNTYRVSVDDAVIAPTTFTPNGAWNASTNSPDMNVSTNRVNGSTYYVYYVSVTGTVDLGTGATLFEAGGRIEWFSPTVYNYIPPASSVPPASETVAGRVELATDAETETGTDTARALTPANASATYIKKSLVDGKGDLLVGSADNTLARLAVGTDGQAAVADSTAPLGIKWATLPAGITAWTASTAYAANAFVYQSGRILRRLSAGTSQVSFNATEAAAWQVLHNQRYQYVGVSAYTVTDEEIVVAGATAVAITLPEQNTRSGLPIVIVADWNPSCTVTLVTTGFFDQILGGASFVLQPGEVLTLIPYNDGATGTGWRVSYPIFRNTVNAKGDLIAGTANDTVDRLAVGVDGTVPIADSTAATGLAYGVHIERKFAPGNLTGNVIYGPTTTVDIANYFVFPQTSAGISATIPDPTVATKHRTIVLENTGTESLAILFSGSGQGFSLTPSDVISLVWNGTKWVASLAQLAVYPEFASAAQTGSIGGQINGTFGVVTMNTVRASQGIAAVASGSPFTIRSPGVYRLYATGKWSVNLNGNCSARFTVNGTAVGTTRVLPITNGEQREYSLEYVGSLAAGDVISQQSTFSGSATFTQNNIEFTIQKLGGFAPILGTTVDNGVFAYRANVAINISAVNTPVPLDTVLSGNLSLASNRIALKAGKTYRLTGMVPYNDAIAANLRFRFFDVTGNAYIASNAGLALHSGVTNGGSLPTVEAIFTPAVNSNVELRIFTGSSGALAVTAAQAATDLIGPHVVVQQIGSTAFSGAIDYSTQETLTGRVFVTGKPIYRKTVAFTNVASGNTFIDATLSITTIQDLISLGGVFKEASFHLPLPYTDVSAAANSVPVILVAGGLQLTRGASRSATNSGYVTLEYTKV